MTRPEVTVAMMQTSRHLADLTFNVIREVHEQHYTHRLGSRPESCPVCQIAKRLSTYE